MIRLYFLILIASCSLCLNNAFAGCGESHVSYQGSQDPDDDEFIYQWSRTFNEAKNKYDSGNNSFSTSGKVWECDNEQGCSDGTWILIKGYHWNDKHYTSAGLLRCSTTPDKWVQSSLKDCYTQWGNSAKPTGNWKKVNIQDFVYKDGSEFYQLYGMSLCILKAEIANCLKDTHGVWNGKVCQCASVDGVQYTWNTKQKKCIANGGVSNTCTNGVTEDRTCSQDEINKHAATCLRQCMDGKWKTAIKTCTDKYECIQYPDGIGCKECKLKGDKVIVGKDPVPKQPKQPVSPKTCRDKRSTANGKACCDTGATGKYDAASDTCVCDGDLQFVIENGKGFCRTKAGTPAYQCPGDKLQWAAGLKVQCANNIQIDSMIEIIETYCRGTGISESAFNKYIEQLTGLVATLCTNTEEQKLCDKISDAHMVGKECKCDDPKKQLNREQEKCLDPNEATDARKRIADIVNKLNQLKAGLGTSVWKDREGNFNTARLASDSIAGVVLGTAGGLITSNVIKKNQIKGGFEDINCAIGGQTVAGFGDEFQVGIR